MHASVNPPDTFLGQSSVFGTFLQTERNAEFSIPVAGVSA
jgi:hypothetical protein